MSEQLAKRPSLIPEVEIDYGGLEPVTGDHLAIPVTVWSRVAHAVGYAVGSDRDNPMLQQAAEDIGGLYAVVRFRARGSK